MPFYATYVIPTNLNNPSFFNNKLLICTTEGFKWIDITALQENPSKPKPHPRYKCPVCFTSSNGGTLAPPSDIIAIVPNTDTQLLDFSSPMQPYTQLSFLTNWRQSRAPPHSSSV